jgi:hypothetical protein
MKVTLEFPVSERDGPSLTARGLIRSGARLHGCPDVRGTLAGLAAALLVVLSAGSCPAAEEKTHLFDSDFNLKPAVLHASKGSDWAAALRWRGRLAYDYSPWRGSLTAFASGQTQGTLATDARAHSEDIWAEINTGLAWQLQRAVKLGTAPPRGERDPTAPSTGPPPGGGLRLGRLEVGLKVRFETDQPLENYALTYGPQLGYFHNNEQGLWPLVPSFSLDYQRVDLLDSLYYRRLGLNDDDSFFRFSTVASWQLPVGTWLARDNRYVNSLGAVANLRHTLAREVPNAIKLQGKDESWYCEAGLNYAFKNVGAKWLRSAYVTVARGRLPPATENKTVIYVGLVVGWPLEGRHRSY